MRRRFDVRDRLATGGGDDAERAELRERLAMFATATGSRR